MSSLHPLGHSGPEAIAKAVKKWLEASEAEICYIEPEFPREIACFEASISRFSNELLRK